MRGKMIHNLALVAPLESAARKLGATVCREYRVVTRSVDGFVDLFVSYKSRRIVFEAERTLDRVRWDIMKAVALKADQLHIIFPNGRLARAAQTRADEAKASWKLNGLEILCLTVSAALQRLENKNAFEVHLYVPETSIQQNAPQDLKHQNSVCHERSVESCKSVGTTSSR